MWFFFFLKCELGLTPEDILGKWVETPSQFLRFSAVRTPVHIAIVHKYIILHRIARDNRSEWPVNPEQIKPQLFRHSALYKLKYVPVKKRSITERRWFRPGRLWGHKKTPIAESGDLFWRCGTAGNTIFNDQTFHNSGKVKKKKNQFFT